MMRRILVTSALPYANGSIHLGHLVEYIQTDIWVRFQKMRGHDCIYVCADDTHGTPVMIRAHREGITPEELVGRMHREHRLDFEEFFIEFDNYYSTHSPENKLLAEEIYNNNRDAGHIVRQNIRQAYCRKDAMFLPDRFIRGTCPSCKAMDQYGDSCEACGATYSPIDLHDAHCALCGQPPEERQSEHLFFKLSDFKPFLQEWVRSGTVQDEVANKLDEWLQGELKEWDISRDRPYFGFQIPDAKDKYFYVWLDAPIGYMASTLEFCQRTGRDFDGYWRRDWAEVYHFIGKDIVYFHTLFWPALLKGAGFRLPTGVFCHGFLTVNGQKMSKSRGTFINARQYLNHLDPQYLRYYYAAKLTSRVDDIDLNLDDFIARVNSDLVGKVVNLASRSAGFIEKRFSGQLSAHYPEDGGLYKELLHAGEEIADWYEKREFSRAMQAIMRLAERANQFVELRAPWLLAKDLDKEQELQDACTIALNLFRIIITYLKPVLPTMAKAVEQFLATAPLSWEACEEPLIAQRIQPYRHLLVRVDPKKVEALVEATKEELTKERPLTITPQSGPAISNQEAPLAMSKPDPLAAEITLDQFTTIDLRVARILDAQQVAGADKLLRLQLDLGELGQRTVFAGIKMAYRPEELIGRMTVMIANLQPRKMKFGVSEGMVLAAGPGGSDLFLTSVDAGAHPGMRLK